jgi:hypothetical protein
MTTRNRTSALEMERDGLEALREALHGAGLAALVVKVPEPRASALVEVSIDDRAFELIVETMSVCDSSRARALVVDFVPPDPALPILVADKITAEARSVFTEAGWSWFDRRGTLHLRAPGVRIEVEVAPMPRQRPLGTATPIAGRAGVTVTYWLCAHHGTAISPNRQALELGVAPSTISRVTTQLTAAGLLDESRQPVLPELFWELAAVWPAERRWILRPPHPQPAGPDVSTWRRTGTEVAAAYGAPVVTARQGPVELYVPGPVELSIAMRRYGAAEPGTGAATLAVAPTSLVMSGPDEDQELMVGAWPAAPVLAVALDLAKDRARGREILEGWEAGRGIWN